MLIAPQAPAATAMHSTAVNPSTGFIRPGATSSPISPVNTTRLITRGFSNAIQSRMSVSARVISGTPAVRREASSPRSAAAIGAVTSLT